MKQDEVGVGRSQRGKDGQRPGLATARSIATITSHLVGTREIRERKFALDMYATSLYGEMGS